jgi:hypothetical protein
MIRFPIPCQIPLLTFGAIAIASSPSFAAPQNGYQQVERHLATRSVVNTKLYPGRITPLDFSQTNETIFYVGLGDSSRVVYFTDAPLDSGKAQTVFLRPIQPLTFPGATTAKVTNLVVKTIDSTGKKYIYNFAILHSQGQPTHLGIQIVLTTGTNTIHLGNGRTGTLNDVEIGLQRAIARGYTRADDPIVLKVRNFLAIARNQNLSLAEAAQSAGIDLAVITELAKISFETFTQSVESKQ